MRRRTLHDSIHGWGDLFQLVGLIAHSDLGAFKAICRHVERGLRTGEVSDEEVVDAIFNCPDHFASTFSGQLDCKLGITETISTSDQPLVDAADLALKYSISGTGSISGVTSIAAFRKTLSTGTATIDLTSLTHNNATISFSGITVKYAAMKNPSANLISVTAGASNGNDMFGATFLFSVKPNDVLAWKLAASQVVGGSDKTLDLSGTGSQYMDFLLAAG